MLAIGDPEDNSPDFATPPLIYDATLYEEEVLRLPYGKTEDKVHEELAAAAREAGIVRADHCLDSNRRCISTAISTMTISTERRSSSSIRSLSTGVTSDPSRNSKEQHSIDSSVLGITALPVRPSYDSVIEAILPRVALSRSSSAPVTPPLTSRFDFSARKFGLKRKRGRLPSIFRRDSAGASSSKSPQDSPISSSPRLSISSQNPVASLDCGHSVSRSSIRAQVKDSSGGYEYLPPSCCGKPIPGAVLETFMTKEEMDVLVEVLVHTYGLEATSDQNSFQTSDEAVNSIASERLTPREASDLGLHNFQPVLEEEIAVSEEILVDPEYQSLQNEQAEEFDRFRLFEYKQQRALAAHYNRVLAKVAYQDVYRREKLGRKHILALERLEELQIDAELEMRRTHAEEIQKVATALKHMERYCRGSVSSLSQEANSVADVEMPCHPVSDDDLAKLKRQYAIQENLPRKHESAINVLRARQEKRFKARQDQQACELNDLDAQNEDQRIFLEALQAKDVERLEELVEVRKGRLGMRWELRMEMWKCQYQKDNELDSAIWLPKIEWPDALPADVKLDVTDSRSALDEIIAPTGQDSEKLEDGGLETSPAVSPKTMLVELYD